MAMFSIAVVCMLFAAESAARTPSPRPPPRPCSEIRTSHRAIGDALKQTRLGSVDECARACRSASDCSAFSFDVIDTQTCTLHKGSVKIVPESGWVAVMCRQTAGFPERSARIGSSDFPYLPGLDYFEKGIEAIQDVVNRTEHIRLPVYAWSSKLGHNWYDPQTQQTFAIPDQLSFTENMAGYEKIDDLYTTEFTQTISEQTNSYSWGVSVGVNYAGISASVSYSDNKQWYNYDNEVRSQQNYVSHSLMWWKFFELLAYPMDVLGTDGLDPMFVGYLERLPPTINNASDRSKYEFLVANWGTHYVKWANFGGKLQLDVFIDKSYASSMTQQWMSDQNSLQFHFQFYAIDPSAQIAGFHNKSEIHRNSSYLSHSRTYVYWQGGDPTMMDTNNLVPWKASIGAAPHWLNVTLEPLWTLPMLTPQQSKTLHNFTTAYLDRNTLNPKTAPPTQART